MRPRCASAAAALMLLLPLPGAAAPPRRREEGGSGGGGGGAAAAAGVAPRPDGDGAVVIANFEHPVIVHVAEDTHAWFSAILDPQTGPLVVSCSLGGDGTSPKCPGTCAGTPAGGGQCPTVNRSSVPCSLTKLSTNGGKSWSVLPDWAGANEILPLGSNGSFVTLPYRVIVDFNATSSAPANTTATSVNSYGLIDAGGHYTHTVDFKMRWAIPPSSGNTTWPPTLVHSGSVVQLKDGSHLTTMYGHGSGAYRHWNRHPAVFFVHSTDSGRSWMLRSLIPWQSAFGASSDGPGEPTTARLQDGTLWCIFRSDSTQFYWSATSRDEGLSWQNISKLPFAWSVKPRLRVTSSGILVLTGGRPGIDLWASKDKGVSWTRFNLAKEHNRLMAGQPLSLLYDEQVLRADGPHVPRALPEPQTSSYTGLAEAADGAMVISYDRLANGWKDRKWLKNRTLAPGCWGSADVLFSMRVTLKTDDGEGAMLFSHAVTLTADTPWVVSPTESDAVAAVIGRPARHLQPNNMKPDGKGCGSDTHCRNVGPFRQAQVRSDLGQDAYKVLGSPPVLLSNPPSPQMVKAGEVVIFLGTVTAAPWLLQLFPALAHDCIGGTWEEHCVRSFNFGNGSAIVATGTGDRGAIFAAYTLSHELLGVSPLYYWSGREPAYRGSVAVELPLNITFATPDYKYRALFPNDEDLLAGHFADPAGQNVISVEPWSRLCETALRLKANTIQAGTVSYPDEAIVAVAARRGLVLTASHFNLVGSNTYRWPLELSALPNQGWDWRKDPQSMAHLWRASIDAQKDLGEVLWSVGLRGVTDSDYTACGTNKALCAQITNEVVSNMTSWIRDAHGPDAPIIWFLFGGAAELMAAGLLKPPRGVIFLASDNYPHIGEINAVPPNLTGGVYYHAAWMSTYTSQLAEMVPPATFYSQLEKYRKTGSTDVFVLNVSDLMPVLMAAELIMNYLWSRVEVEQASSIAVASTQALTAWTAREYTDGNKTTAGEVIALLERYYELVLVPNGEWTPLHGNTTVGDVWLANLTRAMAWCAIDTLPEADKHCDMSHLTTDTITSIAKQVRTSPVVPRLSVLDTDTERLASKLDAAGSSGAGFFRASVGLRHSMFNNLWVAAVATANAIESYTHTSRPVSARQASISANISLAESAFQRIFAYQRTAEAATGFLGMYANDKLSDLHRSRRVVRQLGAFLLNLLQSKSSAGLVTLEDTGGSLYQFYDYQLEHQRSYPLLHKSSRWNLYRLVRVSCVVNQAGSDCRTSADGGRFRGTVHIQMEAIDQCPIRFEMVAGTRPPAQPTTDSKLYTGPMLISATTTFKAALACGNESEREWLVSSLTFTSEAQQPRVTLKTDDDSGMAQPYLTFSSMGGKPYEVTADNRSWLLNGSRSLILSGSVHPPRVAYSDWDVVLRKMREDHLNMVQIYVFWNYHEAVRGELNFTVGTRRDLQGFLRKAAAADLFVDVRIGPYVCAEWNGGGLPRWLRYVPGFSCSRSNDPVWEREMTRFVREVAKQVEPFLARAGGPVIMAQIENELHKPDDDPYVTYCGALVKELALDIPWVMCNGASANNTINTCNGPHCAGGADSYASLHQRSHPSQPLGWTEDWSGFTAWTGSELLTTTKAMTTAITQWFAAGGAHHNFYMYYGGNHVERWAAASLINSYGDASNLHSDLQSHEPHRSHLRKLHAALVQKNAALMGTAAQTELYSAVGNSSECTLGTGLQLCDPTDKAQGFSFPSHDDDDGSSSQPGGATGLVKATASGLCVSGACPDPATNGSCAPMSLVACDTTDPLQLWQHLDNRTLLGDAGFGYLKNKASGQCLGKWGGPRGTEPVAGTANCSIGWGTGGLQWRFILGQAKNGHWDPNAAHQPAPSSSALCLTDGHLPTSAVVAYTYSATAAGRSVGGGDECKGRASSTADPVTFLHNTGSQNQHVEFQGTQLWINGSFLIVDQDTTVLFDGGAVDLDVPCIRQYDPIKGGGDSNPLHWQAVQEVLPQTPGTAAEGWRLSAGPLEQLNTTDDRTDYMLYLTSLPSSSLGVSPSGEELSAEAVARPSVEEQSTTSNLTIGTVESMAFVPFLAGLGQPSVWDATKGGSARSLTVPLVVPLAPAPLLLVSVNIGNANFHGYSPESLQKGIVGQVTWLGKNLADPENAAVAWAQLPGLPGEHAGRGAGGGAGWKPAEAVVPPGQSLTWYKTSFPDPRPAAPVNSSLLFDANGLSRGHLRTSTALTLGGAYHQ